MSKLLKKISIITLLFACSTMYSQTNIEVEYDKYYDTLLIINNILVSSDKVMLTREQILEADTILVNQKGLIVAGFNFSSLSLGNNVSLNSNGCRITEEMKNVIKNSDVSYKFFYLKDIILYSSGSKELEPSTKTVKVTFSN